MKKKLPIKLSTYVITISCLFFWIPGAFAFQTDSLKTYKGRVVDDNDLPVYKAEIRSDKRTQPVLTDSSGVFSIIAAKAEKLQISFADWVHVATAVVHRVHQFHTFDGKKSRPDAKKKLIPLSGKPIVRGLHICTPQADQARLPGT